MGSTGREKLVELQLLNNAQLTNPVNNYAPSLKTMLAKKYEMAQHYAMNCSCMLQLLCMLADQTTAYESDSDSESQYSDDDSDTNESDSSTTLHCFSLPKEDVQSTYSVR